MGKRQDSCEDRVLVFGAVGTGDLDAIEAEIEFE